MERLPNIHPDEILRLDFLEPMGITPYRLAQDIGVRRMRVSDILHGKRDITPDTAIRLGLYFGIEPEFWLNLQAHYNLVETRRANLSEYQAIRPRSVFNKAA
jgi:addiction module HigA family antidote